MRDVETTEFAWREAGAGEPVVFLHGLGGSRVAWDAQLAGLADAYRCIAWDAPGYGRSRALPDGWTFASLADAVARLLDELDVARAHLVGLSLGGMIAQYAAATHPERIRSLALLSTSPAFGLDGSTVAEWRAARLAPLDAGEHPVDFADAVLRSIAGPALTEEALAGQREAMARITPEALRVAIDCLVTHDARAILPRVTVPTLVLVGALDDETPPAYGEAIAALVPGACFVVVPDAGHLLPAEAPEVVNALLREHVGRAA